MIALRARQRGFLLNPFRFGGGGGGGSDPDFANVSSLLHFNGSDGSTTFTDVTGKTWTGYGDAQLDTAQSKFGASSLLLDGTGDRINTPDHASLQMGSGNFTIEAWLRTSSDLQTATFLAKGANGASLWAYALKVSSGGFIFDGWLPGFVTYSVTGGVVPANTWCHVAGVRDGDVFRLFVDGTQIGTDTKTGAVTDLGSDLSIGAFADGDDPFVGWIDDVRVTKGVARYTSGFTPPSSQFPDS